MRPGVVIRDRNRIRRLRKLGFKEWSVAEQCGCTISDVRQAMVDTRGPRKRQTRKNMAARELMAEGLDPAVIRKVFG